MTYRPGRDDSLGFTLLELLVALILIGAMMASMVAGLNFGVTSWRHAHAVADASTEAASASSALGKLFAAVHPEYASPDRFDKRLYFEGSEDSVEFLAALPEAIEHDVIARQFLYLPEGQAQAGKTLTLAWALDLPESSAQLLARTETPILNGVSKLEIRYWGSTADSPAPSWHDRWSSQSSLPTLVHIEIGMFERPTIRIDARVRADTPLSCLYDPVNSTCRRP